MKKRIKCYVIEATVLFKNPNKMTVFTFISQSIESVILDLQELYPDKNITRESILKWKFLTNAEYKELQEKLKGEPNDKRSVASKAK